MFKGGRDRRSIPVDEWIHKQLAQVLPQATESDRTPECVDEAYIQRFTAKRKPPLTDQKTMHVLDCKYCMRRVKLAQKAHREKEEARLLAVRPARLRLLFAAIAAGILVVVTIAYQEFKPARTPSATIQSQTIGVTVDLSSALTASAVGSRSTTVEPATLPAAPLHLSLLLPEANLAGAYTVEVAKEENQEHVVARVAGVTTGSEGKLAISVDLDLRSLNPGDYYLATLYGSEAVTYFPLRVRAPELRGR